MIRRHRDPALEHIVEEATEWFTRNQDPASGLAEQTAFADWLRRSPLHVQEYLAVSRVWGDLTPEDCAEFTADELIRTARSDAEPNNVTGLRGSWRPSAVVVHRRIPRWQWITATMVVIACVLGVCLWMQRTDGLRYATVTGETKAIQLIDGSNVHLNGNSSIRVSMGRAERRVELSQGEARFDVAHDPRRPFLVVTKRATVRAVGTAFNVQASPSRTAVTVLEGSVEIVGSSEPPPLAITGDATGLQKSIDAMSRVQLVAGQHAAVTETGKVVTGEGPSTDEVRAWSERRLVFREESLADVIAEFNRYNERPIELDDQTLAAVYISGTFDANDPGSLIEYLQKYEGLQAYGARGGPLKLTRRPAAMKAP
jgi:transmembrane sensor